MPLYETICSDCGKEKDVLVRSHSDPMPPCREPNCCGVLHRTVSATNFNLKGTGWYKPGASR